MIRKHTPQNDSIYLLINQDLKHNIKNLAFAKGIKYQTLIKAWLEEKYHEESAKLG